jgi:putative transposase
MNAIAAERRRFGYRKIGILLRREGFAVNHKRVFRIYQDEGLAVRRRRKRHVRVARGNTPPIVTRPNERWSVDFIADTFASGCTMRAMTWTQIGIPRMLPLPHNYPRLRVGGLGLSPGI